MAEISKATFDIGATGSLYREKYGFYDPEKYVFKARKGLDRDIVEEISWMKNEPEWMHHFRLRALDLFYKKPMPQWGGNLNEIDFDDIHYFLRATDRPEQSWEEVPDDIKRTFDRLGIPEAERKFLAGVGAQYECLSGDARVYTTRGLVPIREVQSGDTVFSFDEDANQLTPSKVKATTAKGEREVFQVRVGTRTIKATSNHPFLVLDYQRASGKQRGRYRRVWKYLHELKPGDLVAVAKQLPETGQTYTLRQPAIKTQVVGRNQSVEYPLDITGRYNPASLPQQSSPDMMWWLGSYDCSSAGGTTFRQHANEFIGFARIDSITPAGTVPVYDIEIEGPHNFVAEGLIVHNSEVVYHNIKESLSKQGVIFVDTDTAVREYPDLVKKYFGTVIPPADNKFAALNSAVWSGGSMIYVPPGVRVEMPLQAYFRINAQSMGQFERTLIIADEGSYVHYVEGCFLAGARVRTRDGDKAIEAIRAGDEVLTHRGRYRKVYHTMQRPYQGTVYHIRYYGDSAQELHVTEEHPLLVVRRERAHERNRQFSPEWLTAAEVKPGDYLAIPVPAANDSIGDAYHTTVSVGRGGRHAPVERDVKLPFEPDLFRLIGYYFAKGHVDNEHYLSFSFNTAEEHYLRDAKELLVRYFGKDPIENRPRQNGQTLVLCSTQVARVFATEFGSTAYDKHVPDWVKNVPLDCLAGLVSGMWRGDGSYDAKKNMFRFNSISRDLAYAFRDALLRLGIAASVNMQSRDKPRQDIYAVVISSPWNSQFGAIVGRDAPAGRQSGSPFYLDEQYLYVPIRAIEIEEMETTVYNFSVEEDESYVGEGVVSHNCTAPIYSKDSLHSAVVEIIVARGARVRYTTIQNWSMNVYNLVTKRAVAHEDATMEWVDCNLGCLTSDSKVLLNNNVKPISEVEPGDLVYSVDSDMNLVRNRVLAKKHNGKQPVFRLRAENYREIKATANHPFLTLSKKGKHVSLVWKRLDQLATDDLVGIAGNVPDSGVLKDFSRVAAIEPLGIEDTWDLEIANSHNFIADGFIVHNSKLTMKYPAVYMMGKGAHGEVLSVAFAGKGQHQDAGAKMVHGAPHTSSLITSKSISKDGGRTSYRGLLKVYPGCEGVKSNVRCDALLLDEQSRSDTYPYIEVDEDNVTIGHEASVSKIGEEQLFYLMSRGLTEAEASTMIVNGFIEPIAKELPLEFAVELNRLLQLQMEGSVG